MNPCRSKVSRVLSPLQSRPLQFLADFLRRWCEEEEDSRGDDFSLSPQECLSRIPELPQVCAALSGQRQLKQHVFYLQRMSLSLGSAGLERCSCQRAAPQRVRLPGETGRCADGRAAGMTLFSGAAPLMCSAVLLFTTCRASD